ncbi:permease-like cell division protein FtsX [Streptomyces virginiae]|uniref:Cell division protein FtsX n=1 Tax=Streptomyces virginiae TaxID=1961 RepID=A0ABQ3NWU3_STRVG|nr:MULTISPECIES: permease-like cell division protein FtsX [Streptomyces]KOU18172.1 cell division protein FtsX [Streptomyces sp. WM6349]KOU86007.1 cell division protein FtsX [Streptomyces sp. XY593]KOV03157.1 cell division protein FtsX [Streptomyces sp. XY511]KOV43962.1 cell division protein FtsX [Streptomyces sp. H036]MBP2344397.1 cell division transport system permease protein [Streptomyces virginiae]
MRAQFVMSEIGVGLRRNLTMTFAVIISVALSLALFGGSLLMSEQVGRMKGYWYDKANVSIYLCNKQDAQEAGEAANSGGGGAGGVATCRKGAVTDEQKKQIESELKAMSLVKSVTYESADEAYKHYQEQYGHTALASSITPDQMQESFRVKLKNPEKYKVVTSAFAGRDGIHTVDDQRQAIDDLFRILNYLNMAAVGIMAIMLIVALLLIVNTVRVSAFSRRRETGIMRLVGASSFYIQVPFIMEAAVAGLIGALFACVMLVSGQYFVIDHGVGLRDKIQLIDFMGWGSVLAKLPYVLFIGLLMPSMAAFIALRKYLKV